MVVRASCENFDSLLDADSAGSECELLGCVIGLSIA